MNKIYKVVWNKARNCYVVASEFAKNHSTSSVSKKSASAVLLAVTVLLSGGVSVYADNNLAPTITKIEIGQDATATGQNGVAIGSGTEASGLDSIAIGGNTKATGDDSIAIGDDTTAKGMYSVAIGDDIHFTGVSATAVGQQAHATGNVSTAIGTMTNVDADYNFQNKRWRIAGEQSTAIGAYAGSWGLASTAVGGYSKAEGRLATAVGYHSQANVDYGTALGDYSEVKAGWGVAIGASSVADRESGVVGAFAPEGADSLTWKANAGAVSVGSETITRQITNVAAGTEATDAVNVGQLKEVGEVAANANKGWNLSTNGVATEATNVAPGEIVDFNGDKNISVSHDKTKVNVELNKNLKDIETISNGGATLTLGAMGGMVSEFANGQGASVKLFGDTTTINGKVNVYKDGRIAGVADGVNANDAVNVGQLKNSAWKLAANGVLTEAEDVKAGDYVDFNGDQNVSVSKDAKDGVKTVKVELNKDLKDIESISNDGASLTLNGTATELTNGKGAAITLFGDTTTINNKVTVYNDGRIAGVAAGAVTADSTDAVNGSQLHAVQQEAGKHTKVVNGSNITVEETDQDGQKTYKVGLNKDILLGDITGKNVSISGTNGTIETTGYIATKDRVYADKGAKLADVDITGDTISNDKSSVKLDKEGTVTVNNKVTIDGNGKVSGVAAGEISNTSTDAVNGSQLKKTNDRVTNVENNVKNIQGDITNIKGDITNIKGDITTIKGDVTILGDRVTKVEQEAGKHTKVVNGSNVTVEETDQDGQKTYKVGLNKDLLLGDITGKNVSISGTNGTIETTGSIATKDKIYADKGAKLADIDITGDTISNGQSSVKLDKEGTVTINGKVSVNQNGKVSGVAAGDISATSTDAVNGSQLFATNQQVVQNAQSISKLGNRINKVGAGAAALAALHPLDFDPDAKWDFAAGYGNYRGANAAAVGAYYRPNEDTMFSVGGSFGNGENMVNAGVSFKLGSGSSHVSTSRVAMAKEIKELRGELEAMKSAMLDANAGKKIDTSKLQLFPDVPQNHWAYEYVAQLAGNGMIEGYPDGNFAGDRPMTRYEFAAILYRAMMKGAVLSDKILSEFSHELEYFTVDTIAKDKAGNPTIQRVRTVKENKNK